MTSLDIRNNSAVMKRAEQLKRWEESDTNQQPPVPRPDRGSRIKFSSGCIFLAACLAGDKEEVLKLLEQGADINTANVDGLTALHQACIDDNLEMVEFLVEQGADINRQDNEGWTPLHATASCGFVSIARYLVEHGADVAAVNSDGDLAVDLAVDIQHLPMIDFMQKMVAEQQIDCAKARQAEQQQMLADAKKWLRSDASEIDRPHPKTGATALHVAAAKGYTKVLSLLLAGRANVDAQDNDGWTPLHAAAHWGQKEAAQMLLDAMADMDAHNYAGQTCIDVADRKMVKYLEEYRANNKRIKRRPSSQISRISDTIENHMDKTPPKIIRVEVRPDNNKDHPNDDKTSVQKTIEPATDDEAPWRRNNVARVRTSNDSPSKNQVPDVIDVNKTTTATSNSTTTETTDVILRRTQSFENDEKFYQKYNELRARIKANSCPIIPATLQQQQQLHQQQQQQQQQEQLQQNNNVNNNNINNNLNNNSNNINRNSSSSSRPNNINNSSSSSSNNTPHTQFSTTTTKSLLSPTTFSLSSSSLPASTTTANTFAAAATTTQHHNISPSSATAATTTPTIATTAAPANQYTSPLYSSSSSNIISSPLYTVQRSASLKDHKQIFIRKSPPVSPAVSTTPAYTTTTNTTASPAAVATPIRSTTQTQQAKVVQNSSPNKDKNTNQTTSTTTNTNTINNNNSKTSPESKQAIQNNNNNNTTTTTNNNGSTATEAVKPKQSTGNMIKNFFKSFVPPVRDEESETQRKAHAKRVRETRRSTQGVTLDEIKSAEELVKKKNSSMNNNNNNSSSFKLEDANAGNTYPPTNSTIIPSAPAVIAAANSMSQRRINNVNAISSSNTSLNSIGRPVSAPPISNLSNTSNTNTSSSASSSTNNTTSSITSGSSNLKSDDKTTDNSSTTNNTTTTSSSGIGSSYSARRASANTSTTALNPESSSTSSSVAATTAATTSTSLSNNDDKDNDKENDNRSALATQAVIQRRRKPKRRSTGVVHIDMDELDPEKQDSANDNEDKDKEKESGSENRGSRSRAGSTVSVATSTSSATDDKKTRDKTENSSGDNIDYKALWEAVKLENEKLRAQLKKKDEEVIQTRATLERFANAQLDAYKTENLRLKEENGALIRVISKLSK
ncbi:myosin binding subunit isoform X19 [Musca autumnalis]|uniref:myosin binding subunit isoform X19 n=1 Tax=Musca autumnalis TaxID=221902 RepID=UPI003CEE0436